MPNPNSDSVRRTRRAAARRATENVEHLIDAAEAVFAERGYHSANVHEICTRANVGIGTFYAHFDHKKQLLQRVMQERAKTVPELLTVDDFFDVGRLAEKLTETVDEPTSAGLWRAWHEAVLEHDDISHFHAEWRKQVLDQFAELVTGARTRAGLDPDRVDARVVSWTLITLFRELAIHERVGAPDLEALARLSQRLIFGRTRVVARQDAASRA